MIEKIIKDIRFIILILLSISSFILIISPYYLNLNDVTVDSVTNNNCSIQIGDVINQISGNIITNEEEFIQSFENRRSDEFINIVVNGENKGCKINEDGNIGITVIKENKEPLNFGIDIQGGTKVLLKPTSSINEKELDETIKTLENRINFFGLNEVKISPITNVLTEDSFIQIDMSGGTGDDVRDFLSKQGVFEAKLSQRINFVDGQGELRLGEDFHIIRFDDVRKVILLENDITYSVNDSFSIDNETITIISIEDTIAAVYIDLFEGSDVENVLSGSQSSQVIPRGDGTYEFSFTVQVSDYGAGKFRKLTSGYSSNRNSFDNNYIEPKLILLLDGRLITELNIATSIAGTFAKTATISGGANSLEEANREKLLIESTLRSGSLPVKLEIVKVDTITESSGKELVRSTVYVALAGIIAVIIIIAYRYRDYKIILPMILISLLEILIVLGMASNQIFAGVVILLAVVIGVIKKEVTGLIGWITFIAMIGVASSIVITQWTIDIPVIAGFIAILGAGIGQLIIMTDQLFKEKGKHLDERRKVAMHMIWSSAATIVFAMIPLILGGIGSLKGFAIATIIGVFIGILITRPAYVAIIERLKKKELV